MFSRIGFHCIFRIGFRVGLALAIIDGSRIQYFLDLLFRDMTAIHPATGMTGKDEPAVTVKWVMRRNYSLPGFLRACRYRCGCPILTGQKHESNKNESEKGAE